MALRRPTWPKPCLNLVSSRSAPLPELRTAPSAPTFSNRRRLASQSAAASAVSAHATPQFSEFMPPRQKTELDILLRAIQSRNISRICKSFLQWTAVLADHHSPLHPAAILEAQSLSCPTFSEILHNLDPITSRDLDIANGITLSQGEARFTNAGSLVDQFGVRQQHRHVLEGMQILLAVRNSSMHRLTAADYETLMRIAGAAVDGQAAKKFWSAMTTDGLSDARTSKSWNEFMKSRFMTESPYYQFDRSRVVVLARDMYRNLAPMRMATIKRLDAMRLSMGANLKEPWNRRRDEPEEDLRRMLRHRRDYRGYSGHWIRAQYYGHEMDEALLCTSLKAFARSSSLVSIKKLVLEPYYGIKIEDSETPGLYNITGGHKFPKDHPVRPTAELLDAIVEAFGAMSHISLATQLLHYVSRYYSIPISHNVWSNLLNWTYICASKPFRPMRQIAGDYASTTVKAADVRAVWDAMTEGSNNITPSFDDYDIFIKTLIIQRSFTHALNIIRENILPYYYSLLEEHDLALTDEILQASARGEGVPSSVTRRRVQAALRKDNAHHRISNWLTRMLKTASANRGHRDGPVTQSLVPNLVAEFSDFFPQRIRYRTSQGVAVLDRPIDNSKLKGWRQTLRTTIPQRKAGIHARDFEDSDQPGFEYPSVSPMKVLEWQPQPRYRMGRIGKPGDDMWWKRVEDEMLL